MRGRIHSLALFLLSAMVISCSEETPPREHIPVLKQQVYRLQEAVKARDGAAIDSLLSPEILSVKQSSDSLLRFVYGPEDDFAFERFGDCEIVYTADMARIDCFVMDSAARMDRPIVLTFVYKHDLWLLKRFEAGRASLDST
ncbi:MAG: hypothetical protein AB1744_05335 [Candidatus Zixiibacteriota bacterium]